jgi:hypothetical protein
MTRRGAEAAILVLTRKYKLNGPVSWKSIWMTK